MAQPRTSQSTTSQATSHASRRLNRKPQGYTDYLFFNAPFSSTDPTNADIISQFNGIYTPGQSFLFGCNQVARLIMMFYFILWLWLIMSIKRTIENGWDRGIMADPYVLWMIGFGTLVSIFYLPGVLCFNRLICLPCFLCCCNDPKNPKYYKFRPKTGQMSASRPIIESILAYNELPPYPCDRESIRIGEEIQNYHNNDQIRSSYHYYNSQSRQDGDYDIYNSIIHHNSEYLPPSNPYTTQQSLQSQITTSQNRIGPQDLNNTSTPMSLQRSTLLSGEVNSPTSINASLLSTQTEEKRSDDITNDSNTNNSINIDNDDRNSNNCSKNDNNAPKTNDNPSKNDKNWNIERDTEYKHDNHGPCRITNRLNRTSQDPHPEQPQEELESISNPNPPPISTLQHQLTIPTYPSQSRRLRHMYDAPGVRAAMESVVAASGAQKTVDFLRERKRLALGDVLSTHYWSNPGHILGGESEDGSDEVVVNINRPCQNHPSTNRQQSPSCHIATTPRHHSQQLTQLHYCIRLETFHELNDEDHEYYYPTSSTSPIQSTPSSPQREQQHSIWSMHPIPLSDPTSTNNTNLNTTASQPSSTTASIPSPQPIPNPPTSLWRIPDRLNDIDDLIDQKRPRMVSYIEDFFLPIVHIEDTSPLTPTAFVRLVEQYCQQPIAVVHIQDDIKIKCVAQTITTLSPIPSSSPTNRQTVSLIEPRDTALPPLLYGLPRSPATRDLDEIIAALAEKWVDKFDPSCRGWRAIGYHFYGPLPDGIVFGGNDDSIDQDGQQLLHHLPILPSSPTMTPSTPLHPSLLYPNHKQQPNLEGYLKAERNGTIGHDSSVIRVQDAHQSYKSIFDHFGIISAQDVQLRHQQRRQQQHEEDEYLQDWRQMNRAEIQTSGTRLRSNQYLSSLSPQASSATTMSSSINSPTNITSNIHHNINRLQSIGSQPLLQDPCQQPRPLSSQITAISSTIVTPHHQLLPNSPNPNTGIQTSSQSSSGITSPSAISPTTPPITSTNFIALNNTSDLNTTNHYFNTIDPYRFPEISILSWFLTFFTPLIYLFMAFIGCLPIVNCCWRRSTREIWYKNRLIVHLPDEGELLDLVRNNQLSRRCVYRNNGLIDAVRRYRLR